MILCLCWFLIAVRASSRAFYYKHLAKQLQNDLLFPKEHVIWMEDVPGIDSARVYWGLILMFGVVWASSAFYGASQPDCVHLRDPVTAIVVIIGLVATSAWIKWRAFGDKLKNLNRVLDAEIRKRKRIAWPASDLEQKQ